MRRKKERRINRARETETDGWAQAKVLHGGQPRLTTWYRTQREKKTARSSKKSQRQKRKFMTFTSHQQYQFTKKIKHKGNLKTGQESWGSDNDAFDTGRNPSIETSFPNAFLVQPREGAISQKGWYRCSRGDWNDKARLLPRGKSDESCSKVSCADTGPRQHSPMEHNYKRKMTAVLKD